MAYKIPNAADIHYSYDTRGYMMYYKDRPIGGAGISKGAKGCRSNLALFRNSAEATKQALLRGGGDEYMKAEIRAIDEEANDHDKV